MQNAEGKKLQVNFYKQEELSKSIFTNAHQITLLLKATHFLALLNWKILLSSPVYFFPLAEIIAMASQKAFKIPCPVQTTFDTLNFCGILEEKQKGKWIIAAITDVYLLAVTLAAN